MRKSQGIKRTNQNNLNQTSKLDSNLSKNKDKKEPKPTLKSKQQIDKDYYQKHREKKKQQRRKRYQQQKLQTQLETQQTQSKYYGAEAFKILISLKQYTELSPEKRKRWLNFAWTFRELADRSDIEVKNIAVSDIVQVMKLREEAENLISDYWDTAKAEVKKDKSWSSLDYDEQQRLIRYWGYEKARIENGYLNEEERLKKQSREYLKEIELAKFHEERGKVKCPCYSCETKKEIQKEVKAKMKRELEEHEKNDKEQCPECKRWVKELDEESGVCKKCVERYD